MSERNLAKNTIFYSVALALQKALSFVYFIILARSLGVAIQGRFSFALSFTSIFAVFLDFGVTQILIREAAREKEKTEKYLANIIGFKLAGSLLLYLAVVLAVNLLGYPAMTRELVYVSGLVMLIDSFTLSAYGAIRSRQNLIFESLGTIGNQLIVLVGGGILLLLHYNPVIVMAVYLLASISNFSWSIYNLKCRFGIKLRVSFDRRLIKSILILSLPFAVAGIFSRIFSATDVVLLSKLANDYAVGIYSTAFKVAFALQFVALAFSASIYPAFSAYWAHARENLAKLFNKSIYWLMFLASPLVFGLIAVADPAMAKIFGQQYAPSVLPVQILMSSMFFVFVCFPIGALLNACDQQTRHTINLGLTALASVVLNLILIPFYSYTGAAIANLLSYLLLFGLGISVAAKIVKIEWRFLFKSFLKIILASVLMFATVWLVKTQVNFIAAIIAGAVVYLVLIFVLKLFSFQAIKDFFRSLKKNPAGSPLEDELI